MDNINLPLIGTIMVTIFGAVLVKYFISWVLGLRRVVPTNEVHIVQKSKKTISYGKDTEDQKGNVYYAWPLWIPIIGVTVTVLPISVFKLELESYDAYDKGRLPFEIDVVAFFRVVDSNMAASRVSSVRELDEQLQFIVKGAARTILASYDIDTIMVERSTFGDHFTKEVEGQLKNWGVATVKNIELMDIRDAAENKVIHNIMAKKKSLIEMESRTEVAKNMKTAQIAEIEAKREADISAQEAAEQVGKRTADKEKAVGISNQKAAQEIKEEERLTTEKHMAVLKVGQVQQAEINKSVKVVEAEQNRDVNILVAQGDLEAKKREAEGMEIAGKAKGAAEQAVLLAPVNAQITLAEKIAALPDYQKYLVDIRTVEANQAVGIEQAKALTGAEIKIIANTGNPVDGIQNVMGLFSPKGGTALAGMAEAFAQSDMGRQILNKVTEEKA